MHKLIQTIAVIMALLTSAALAQETALHIAAKSYDTQKVIALIERGANIEARDKYGSTPLHSAAAWGAAETVNALINAGADPEAKTKDGSTPLELAKKYNRKLNGTDAWWRLN